MKRTLCSKSFPLFALLFWFVSASACADTKNGFRLDNASIPQDQIFQGGPPRDGIPSIDRPYYIGADQAEFMSEGDRVLGLNLNGTTRAYPIKILNWHEIVNDIVDGRAVVVTFCPLCGTGMAFDAQIEGKAMEFGVSGLLYQSDVLLYDRKSFSLWSQVMREAVTGQMKGRKLKQLPLEHTTWKDWLSRYPNTEVLSTETGFSRDYGYTPYAGYERSPNLFFDVNNKAPKAYHPKEQVLGVEIDGKTKAYPFKELSENGKRTFSDSLAGLTFTVHWNESARSAFITNNEQQALVSTTAFWFAWYTFHPETEVFKAP